MEQPDLTGKGSEQIHKGEEVAFLFLSNSPVLLAENENESATTERRMIHERHWIPVKYESLNQMHATASESKKRKWRETPSGNNYCSHACSRCHLVLDPIEHSQEFRFQPSDDTIFDGTTADLKICSFCKKDYTDDLIRNRSDAALIIGMIEKCRREGFLRIETFKILYSNGEKGVENGDASRETDHKMGCKRITTNASMVITISLPHLEAVSQRNQPFLHKCNYDDYLNTSTTSSMLSSSARLLFSLLRSDWSWLDRTMDRLENDRSTSAQLPSVFPTEMSLEALYNRIQGASSQKITSYITAAFDNKSNDPAGDLTALPEDILQTKLAPFLKSRTLHALRLSCKYLHHILKAVVPGMKLELYHHQIKSLEWMRSRESAYQTELDAMISGADNTKVSEILQGDLFRSITSGAVISVIPRRSEGIYRPLWHINSWTGHCSQGYRNELLRTVSSCRSTARGGLLCDDPGLGKTITVLSLILQTYGLSTTPLENEQRNEEKNIITDILLIDSYWNEMLVESTRKFELRGIALQLRKRDHAQYFQYDVMSSLNPDEKKLYLQMISNPICLNDVISKIDNDSYADSIFEFYNDVKMIYENATLFNPPTHFVYDIAKRLLEEFKVLFSEFKQTQLKAALNSQKRSRSNLGAIITQRKKLELYDNLVPSKSTLIIVPLTLLKHWEEQIKLHIDFGACSNKRPLIFHHRGNTKHKRSVNGSSFVELSDFDHACDCEDRYFFAVFLDESAEKLPDPAFLSKFLIVITTTKRLTNEWKHGSFEEQLRQQSDSASSISYRNFNYDACDEHLSWSASSLLKVHWLRLIVDEGHSMGKRGTPTNSIDVASWITAERRFAMTGTPTPQTVSNNGLSNLFGLLKFLKHDYFCAPFYGDERCRAIDKVFRSGDLSSFFQIRQLLNLFMVRHTKNDIQQLHKPIFMRKYTNMSDSEILAYNTLVSAVQSNLIITTMEGKTSGKQDSLLNARQTKHAVQALSNIRLACCGGTDVVPILEEKLWNETIEMMYYKHNHRGYKIAHVQNFLQRMTSKELSVCMCCGILLQTLLLLPCACMFCTECITSSTRRCPGCDEVFDIDDFQQLQPGIIYQWNWNIDQSKKKRDEKHLTEVEIQSILNVHSPRRIYDTNQVANFEADTIREEQLQDGMPASRRRRLNKFDSHICVYADIYLDGRCKICGEIHQCNFMHDKSTTSCPDCHCLSESCPPGESKAFYISKKLMDLWNTYSHRIKASHGITPRRPLKALLFSQFTQILNVIGDRLIRRFGSGCIAEYWGRTRDQELERFAKQNDCFCMLLGKDGSHGLNLQFVTHIFFLDEILGKFSTFIFYPSSLWSLLLLRGNNHFR